MMFAVAWAPAGRERIPQMSQRLLAERHNNPRGDYVAQTINPFVLCVLSPSQRVLAQGAVSRGWWGRTSHRQPRPTARYRNQPCFLGCRVIKNWVHRQKAKRVPFTFRPLDKNNSLEQHTNYHFSFTCYIYMYACITCVRKQKAIWVLKIKYWKKPGSF